MASLAQHHEGQEKADRGKVARGPRVDITPRFSGAEIFEPPKRGGGVKVSGVPELLDKLKADGVI